MVLSTMNLHDVRNLRMSCHPLGEDVGVVDITVEGGAGHDHRLTAFVRVADLPHFERAVKAFNEALKDFVPQPLPGEEPTPINEEMPF